MCDVKKTTAEIIRYGFDILIAILGFLLVSSYNRTNESLAKINSDLIQLRIDVAELNAKMLTEDRVKEIVETEILKKLK